MLSSLHIAPKPGDDSTERDGAIVEFSNTNGGYGYDIPYPRSRLLLEYVTRTCLETWLSAQAPGSIALKDSTTRQTMRQTPMRAVKSVNIAAPASECYGIVRFGWDHPGESRGLYFPYPAGRILLEYIARVCVEEKVDMAMTEGRRTAAEEWLEFLEEADPEAQPFKEAAE